ncbi:MAG: hypothetical protein JWM47_3408, partial [Acidimicrobiales bacterium]|nr:hypothetical protein [Acidimicrobiales bacterium]
AGPAGASSPARPAGAAASAPRPTANFAATPGQAAMRRPGTGHQPTGPRGRSGPAPSSGVAGGNGDLDRPSWGARPAGSSRSLAELDQPVARAHGTGRQGRAPGTSAAGGRLGRVQPPIGVRHLTVGGLATATRMLARRPSSPALGHHGRIPPLGSTTGPGSARPLVSTSLLGSVSPLSSTSLLGSVSPQGSTSLLGSVSPQGSTAFLGSVLLPGSSDGSGSTSSPSPSRSPLRSATINPARGSRPRPLVAQRRRAVRGPTDGRSPLGIAWSTGEPFPSGAFHLAAGGQVSVGADAAAGVHRSGRDSGALPTGSLRDDAARSHAEPLSNAWLTPHTGTQAAGRHRQVDQVTDLLLRRSVRPITLTPTALRGDQRGLAPSIRPPPLTAPGARRSDLLARRSTSRSRPTWPAEARSPLTSRTEALAGSSPAVPAIARRHRAANVAVALDGPATLGSPAAVTAPGNGSADPQAHSMAIARALAPVSRPRTGSDAAAVDVASVRLHPSVARDPIRLRSAGRARWSAAPRVLDRPGMGLTATALARPRRAGVATTSTTLGAIAPDFGPWSSDPLGAAMLRPDVVRRAAMATRPGARHAAAWGGTDGRGLDRRSMPLAIEQTLGRASARRSSIRTAGATAPAGVAPQSFASHGMAARPSVLRRAAAEVAPSAMSGSLAAGPSFLRRAAGIEVPRSAMSGRVAARPSSLRTMGTARPGILDRPAMIPDAGEPPAPSRSSPAPVPTTSSRADVTGRPRIGTVRSASNLVASPSGSGGVTPGDRTGTWRRATRPSGSPYRLAIASGPGSDVVARWGPRGEAPSVGPVRRGGHRPHPLAMERALAADGRRPASAIGAAGPGSRRARSVISRRAAAGPSAPMHAASGQIPGAAPPGPGRRLDEVRGSAQPALPLPSTPSGRRLTVERTRRRTSDTSATSVPRVAGNHQATGARMGASTPSPATGGLISAAHAVPTLAEAGVTATSA